MIVHLGNGDVREYGNGSAPSRGYVAWRRRREYALQRNALSGYSEELGPLSPAVVAGETAALGTRSKTDAIFIGVATGVSVWFITHLLDRIFGVRR